MPGRTSQEPCKTVQDGVLTHSALNGCAILYRTESMRYGPGPNAMLKLTKRTEYGLIALMHLAEHGEELLSVRTIAERFTMPQRLLAQTLQNLTHAGLVESQRGATGGYRLAQPADQITIGSVVHALEGQGGLTSCHEVPSPEPSACSIESLCPIRSPLGRIQHGIWSLLEGATLASLADSTLSPREIFTLPQPIQ